MGGVGGEAGERAKESGSGPDRGSGGSGSDNDGDDGRDGDKGGRGDGSRSVAPDSTGVSGDDIWPRRSDGGCSSSGGKHGRRTATENEFC